VRIPALCLVAAVGVAVAALLVDAARVAPSQRFPGWTLAPVAALCNWTYYPGWFCPPRDNHRRHASLRY